MASFLVVVRNFAVVPTGLVKFLARAIPALELVLGMLLILGSQTRIVALAVVLVLSGFTSAVVLNVRRGHRVPCACFGGSSSPIGVETVVRNIVLLLSAASLVVFDSSGLPEPPQALGAVLIAAAIMELWSILSLTLRVNRLASMLRVTPH